MIRRTFEPPKNNSFFLFGARGTGKTTLLTKHFGLYPKPPTDTLYIDLLDPDLEELYSRSPGRLKQILEESPARYRRVIIDEVQKVVALLDVVHLCIEKYRDIQFILSGSSARKLKHGGGNLLAGRAFSFNLHPLSYSEAPNADDLTELLTWGTLPRIYEYQDPVDKRRFLRTYTQTYLKQEIQLEQLVRDIVSFREFLDLASQVSGEIINYRKIADQTKVDEKTVARYFEILIDTLVGRLLEPYSQSVRARQRAKPKFYLFDTGIQRHLSQQASIPLVARSSDYGKLFEQWIVNECFKLNDYCETDFRFYYLRTKEGAELDLIVQRPGNKRILIEIKSTDSVLERHLSHLRSLGCLLYTSPSPRDH